MYIKSPMSLSLNPHFRTVLLLLVSVLLFAAPTQARQSDPMTEGILAFRSGEYQAAVSHFEKAISQDATNAEAHFLLARIYWETPLRDERRAGRELDNALDLEPENVQFMVARMQQLSAEASNFFTEKIRETRRRELARAILKLDPENSFAHEEMGTAYIRDFWRYRNALMYPALTFNEYKYRAGTTVDPLAGYLVQQAEAFDRNQGILDTPETLTEQIGAVQEGFNPNSVFLADEFDTETLRSQGIPVVDMSGRAQRAYDKAVFHLSTAIETDPRQRSVYDLFMEIYALKGEYQEALNLLSQMYVFFPEDAGLWTYLGYAHYKVGNMDAASKSFETAFRYMTDDEKDAYERLDEILPDDEKKAYEADEVAYTARFWTSKDPRYLTPYNERKLEHYARLTYADLLYGAPEVDLRGWNTERGNILVRYGVPQGDVVIIPRSTSGVRQGVAGSTGTESDPTGNSGLALQVGRSGTDMDLASEANTFNIWDYGTFKFVFEDPFRNGEYRLYSPSSRELADGSLPWMNDYTIKAKETFDKTPELYDYEAPGRQIELPYLVSSFRGMNDQTDIYINYGIPVTEQYDPTQDVINITADAGTFVVGSDRSMLVERRQRIYGLRTDQIVQFDEANLWVNTEEVTSIPGNHEVSVEFETSSGGTVAVQRREVEVHDFSGNRLSMSDVMLAYRIDESFDGKPSVASDIVRHDLSIQPAPWSVFGREQPIYFYFEVYNLELGSDQRARYEVEALLAPKKTGSGVGRAVGRLFGRDQEGVSVRLPIDVASSDDGQYLILSAENQEPGLYTLIVRIHDTLSGQDVDREQDLFLE